LPSPSIMRLTVSLLLFLCALVTIDAKAPLRVLVVGGGPSGLVSSITAAEAGCHVTLVEKRGNYTRGIWFDLQGKPHGIGLDMLRRWGLEQELTRAEDYERFQYDAAVLDVACVRCGALEEFLKRKALAVGVRVDTYTYVSLEQLDQDYTYDVLIGADSINSQVRTDAGIAFR
jgi:2-polyprenyl-6-methoxyphenol hydroxylase-like FAD-dependent oxidoreductase